LASEVVVARTAWAAGLDQSDEVQGVVELPVTGARESMSGVLAAGDLEWSGDELAQDGMELVDAAGVLADQVAAALLQHRQHDRGIVGPYRIGVALQGRDPGCGGRIQHVGLAATPA
jgi:hypothetical protein